MIIIVIIIFVSVDVCSHLGGNVCSLNGVCVGDMFNFTLCSCDDNFFGPFCGERGFESKYCVSL